MVQVLSWSATPTRLSRCTDYSRLNDKVPPKSDQTSKFLDKTKTLELNQPCLN